MILANELPASTMFLRVRCVTSDRLYNYAS